MVHEWKSTDNLIGLIIEENDKKIHTSQGVIYRLWEKNEKMTLVNKCQESMGQQHQNDIVAYNSSETDSILPIRNQFPKVFFKEKKNK